MTYEHYFSKKFSAVLKYINTSVYNAIKLFYKNIIMRSE